MYIYISFFFVIYISRSSLSPFPFDINTHCVRLLLFISVYVSSNSIGGFSNEHFMCTCSVNCLQL